MVYLFHKYFKCIKWRFNKEFLILFLLEVICLFLCDLFTFIYIVIYWQGENLEVCSWGKFEFLNPLTPKSDQHLISPYNITTESHINVRRIKEIITNQKKKLLIVGEILPVSILVNAERTLQRIWIPMLESKGSTLVNLKFTLEP